MSVLYEKRDRIAIITINRPEKHNAVDPQTNQELIKAFTDFRDDKNLWVAILTGAGEKAFCAGADLEYMARFVKLHSIERREQREREPGLGGITRHLQIWKPIIAAINGHCYGGGLEIALACDIRIASENAKLGLLETKWGIMPGQGGTQRLPRLIPLCKALEMIFTAEPIDAHEALRLGLVNRVVPLKDLMPTAIQVAEKICENAPLAVRYAKEAVWRGLDLPLEEGLRLEQLLANLVRDSADTQEGMRAFAEKRKPKYTGH
ncbi:MAG: enoyl-CoA hydratase-related protein [Candidatus Bipolaricaulota bacterium]|nr:enoyl-CoA hydratase-related protein [Candidatus Bipolaricaulota bacterium]MCS7273977.1 enoyl-CoA hydratase-related protein [Candidatus Bipolaricaulota bacterium]MDW8111330.1 enoyl-CoA hydratase-related protein [Candidatus Bipolaricaulota bacterium]MDW8329250.1 enoyl-CoA hydratase-related protein [Candidatus Bipolaricaulota bacterium]